MTMSASKAPTGESLASLRAEAQEAVRALRARISGLDRDGIDLILAGARSHYAWQDRQVPRELLETIYEIAAAGPTSMNICPARFFFIETAEARKRLSGALKPKNVDKMMSAPVTVIIAHDLEFWKELPYLFPHEDRRPYFEGKLEHCVDSAFRNGTLQGAYFMIAARAVGLDVGAMSGFSNQIVDDAFFAGTTLKSNFLCNLGYADETALFQRLPRLPFDTACRFL